MGREFAPGGGGEAASSHHTGSSGSSSSKTGFMHRAFSRQQPGSAAAGTSLAGSNGGGIGGSGAAGVAESDAFATFQQRVREFNACVAYSGPQAGECSSGEEATLSSWCHNRHDQCSEALAARPGVVFSPNLLLHLVRCSAGCRVDDVAILALLAHLPRQRAPALAAAVTAGGSGLGMDEARLAIAALQCLQRLAATTIVASQVICPCSCCCRCYCHALQCCPTLSPSHACVPFCLPPSILHLPPTPPLHARQKAGGGVVGVAAIIGAAGGSGRIFAALQSGHDHVAAEAARLLLRFFAPHAACSGAGPWAGASVQGAADDGFACDGSEQCAC